MNAYLNWVNAILALGIKNSDPDDDLVLLDLVVFEIFCNAMTRDRLTEPQSSRLDTE